MTLKRRGWIFFLFLLLLVLLNIWKTRVVTDLTAFFAAGDSDEEVLLASQMQSGELSRRYILSIERNPANAAGIEAFTQLFAQQLGEISGIERVWNPARQNEMVDALIELYAPHNAHLFSLDPEKDVARLLTRDNLDKRAQVLEKALLSPGGGRIKQIALQDPLLLSLSSLRRISEPLENSAVSAGRYTSLMLESAPSGLNSPAQRVIQDSIRSRFEDANASAGGFYELEMTGVPIFAATIQTIMSEDIRRVSLVSSLALVLLFLWIFRSLKALWWISLVLATSISAAVLITNLVFGYVHGLTMALGTTLIGICIDYPIHALIHVSAAREQSSNKIVSKIWPSLFLGGLTTLIGYAALGLSGYPGFQQISVYAASGIIVALTLTRMVLPGVLQRGAWKLSPSTRMESWIKFCQMYRLPLSASVIATAAISLASLSGLRWIEDLEQMTPELDELKETDKRIRSRLVSVEPGRFVLIRGKDLESSLQKTELVYPLLEDLKNQGDLDNYYGPYPWLLSDSLQRRNQRALQGQWTEQQARWWRDALRQHGLSVKRLGEMKFPEGKPLQLQEIMHSPAKQLLDGQIFIDDDKVLLVIWLAKHKPQAMINALKNVSGVRYFSQRDLLNKLANDYRNRAVTMLCIGVGIIFLLLLARYRSWQDAGRVIMPAMFSALFILAGWTASGYPISFLHLVGFLLAVAICVDYGIFFLENRGGNPLITYRAMAASMLTSAAVFGCLVLASTATLRVLSGTVAFGVLLGFLLCPIFIRPQKVDPV